MISYAQNFEDVMLARALSDIGHGLYVDIGAQDPLVDSVSLAFHEKGWFGIHVEPTQRYAEQLCANRPGDVVIQAAVGRSSTDQPLFEIPNTGISTLDPVIAERHRLSGFDVRETTTRMVTLASVLAMTKGREVHWMKIDVEGFEREALASWGRSPVRPWIVVVESTMPLSQTLSHSAWERMILGRGYEFAYFDGLNRFYVLRGRDDLKRALSAPPNVFDGFQLSGTSSSPFHLAMTQRLDKAQAIADESRRALESQIERQREEAATRERELVEALEATRQRLELAETEYATSQLSEAESRAKLQASLEAARNEFADRERILTDAVGRVKDQSAVELEAQRVRHEQQLLELRATAAERERELRDRIDTAMRDVVWQGQDRNAREKQASAAIAALQEQAATEREALSVAHREQAAILRQSFEQREAELSDALRSARKELAERSRQVESMSQEVAVALRDRIERESELADRVAALVDRSATEREDLLCRHRQQIERLESAQSLLEVQLAESLASARDDSDRQRADKHAAEERFAAAIEALRQDAERERQSLIQAHCEALEHIAETRLARDLESMQQAAASRQFNERLANEHAAQHERFADERRALLAQVGEERRALLDSHAEQLARLESAHEAHEAETLKRLANAERTATSMLREREEAERAAAMDLEALRRAAAAERDELVASHREQSERLQNEHSQNIALLVQQQALLRAALERNEASRRNGDEVARAQIEAIRDHATSERCVLVARHEAALDRIEALRVEREHDLRVQIKAVRGDADRRIEAHAARERALLDDIERARAEVIAERDAAFRALEALDTERARHSRAIAELEAAQRQRQALGERLSSLQQHAGTLEGALREQLDRQRQEAAATRLALEAVRAELIVTRSTLSWRITSPLRRVAAAFVSEPTARQLPVVALGQIEPTTAIVLDSRVQKSAVPPTAMDAPVRGARLSSSTTISDAPAMNAVPASSLDELFALNDEDFVKTTYLTLLRRPADATGLMEYVGQVRQGVRREQIVAALATSPEGRRAAIQLPGLKECIQREAQRGKGLRARLRGLLGIRDVEMQLRALENKLHLLKVSDELRVRRIESLIANHARTLEESTRPLAAQIAALDGRLERLVESSAARSTQIHQSVAAVSQRVDDQACAARQALDEAILRMESRLERIERAAAESERRRAIEALGALTPRPGTRPADAGVETEPVVLGRAAREILKSIRREHAAESGA